jgi:peptidoglycan biosynthesis protein MviN/MurJ (putative lipid II flippase)
MLVWRYKQAGLGIANSISAAANVALLTYSLKRKLSKLEMQSLRRGIGPLLIATTAAGAMAWWGWHSWEGAIGHSNIALKIGAVFIPAIAAAIVYWLVALMFKVPVAKESVELVRAIQSRLRK